MAREYDLTSVGINPAEDRARRMRAYFIAMSVRILCVASLFFVRGWWVLLVGIAVVLLPYFAVMIANQAEHRGASTPEAPTPLELTGGEADSAEGTSGVASEPAGDDAPSASEALLVVDAPAERRSTAPEAETDAAADRPGAEESS